MKARKLSPWRFVFVTVPNAPVPLTSHEGPLGALAEAGKREANERHGRAFRSIREACGLTLREVAQGWGVQEVEVGELERGLRSFRALADLHAATSQLWCWANEVGALRQ